MSTDPHNVGERMQDAVLALAMSESSLTERVRLARSNVQPLTTGEVPQRLRVDFDTALNNETMADEDVARLFVLNLVRLYRDE